MRRNWNHPKRFPLPTLYLRQNLICPPASSLYLKKLLSILQTVSSCSRYTTFFHFGSRFHRQNFKPIPKRSPLFTNLSLNADVLENTLPFVSQSINNFSDYDMTGSVPWLGVSLSIPLCSLDIYLAPNKRPNVSLQYKTFIWFEWAKIQVYCLRYWSSVFNCEFLAMMAFCTKIRKYWKTLIFGKSYVIMTSWWRRNGVTV